MPVSNTPKRLAEAINEYLLNIQDDLDPEALAAYLERMGLTYTEADLDIPEAEPLDPRQLIHVSWKNPKGTGGKVA